MGQILSIILSDISKQRSLDMMCQPNAVQEVLADFIVASQLCVHSDHNRRLTLSETNFSNVQFKLLLCISSNVCGYINDWQPMCFICLHFEFSLSPNTTFLKIMNKPMKNYKRQCYNWPYSIDVRFCNNGHRSLYNEFCYSVGKQHGMQHGLSPILLGLDRKFTGAVYILIVSFQTFTVSYVIHGFQKIKNNWLKHLEELVEGSINHLEQDVCFLVIGNQQ